MICHVQKIHKRHVTTLEDKLERTQFEKQKAAFVCLIHVKYGQWANVEVSVNSSHGKFKTFKDEAVQPVVVKSIKPEMSETVSEIPFTLSRDSSVPHLSAHLLQTFLLCITNGILGQIICFIFFCVAGRYSLQSIALEMYLLIYTDGCNVPTNMS